GKYSTSTCTSAPPGASAAAAVCGDDGCSRCWCPRGDSNPHSSRRYHLKVVRLPIPPPGQRHQAPSFPVSSGFAASDFTGSGAGLSAAGAGTGAGTSLDGGAAVEAAGTSPLDGAGAVGATPAITPRSSVA